MKLSVQIFIAFSLIVLLSLADSYTNYMLSQKVQRNSQFLSNSEAIIRNSNRAHKAIIDMQSSFRGYLLTNDTTFLDSYYTGMDSVPTYLKEQRHLIRNNDGQTALLDSIIHLHGKWVVYSSLLIDKKSKPEYRKLFENRLKKQLGKKLNDQITEKFSQVVKIEYATRKHRSALLMASIEKTHTYSFIFLMLTIIVGVSSTIYIILLITKRIASMVKLAENISKGQFTIVNDTKNDELTGLSQSLNIMSGKLDKNIRELEKPQYGIEQIRLCSITRFKSAHTWYP